MFRVCNKLRFQHTFRFNFNSISLRTLSTSALKVNNTNKNNLKIGDNLHGYTVKRIEDVPELCLTAFHLNHEKTGAQHYHIARDDNENVFGVNFRTTPFDNTGVAHILEHLVLCGSQKYPVKDPFMKMLNRSLSTFMNAFTAPDNTLYPFSTQNIRDYYNLLCVYLDAVFYPLLKPEDFRQEGWRLEHEDINNKSSPIILKGVVFNEMKGVFSSQSAIYARQMLRNLFPSNTYYFESGGDPLNIPDLSYQQLKEFHARVYHPSNAKFYTYGNFPLEFHLSLINEKILNRFSYDENYKRLTFVPEQNKWTSPKSISIECQPDPLAPFPDKQTTVSVSYLLEKITNTHQLFTLAILGLLLTDGPNSPFYQTLIESGLGSDYSPYNGFSGETKQSLFSIGLQGIDKNDINSVISIINNTFVDVANEGFSNDRIEAALHRVELGTRHISKNFGLNLLMQINPYLTHDGDVIQALHVNDHVREFRNRLKQNKNYLKDKIREYFVNNSHKLILTMSPSDDYETKMKEKEHQLLNNKLNSLTQEDKEIIFKNGLELSLKQNAIDDLSLLPTLNVNKDIPKEPVNLPILKLSDIQGVSVQHTEQPTNNIIYFNAIASLDQNLFPPDLIPYLPLFAEVITKLGAGKFDRKQLDHEISLRTGGLGVGVQTNEDPINENIFEQGLLFSSYCLEQNLEHMFNLWKEIFTDVKFDDDYDHLLQLIRISSSELSMNVPYQGHKYAMCRASSSLNKPCNIRELTNGLFSISTIRNEAAKDNALEVVEKLKQIARIVFQQNNLRIAINAESHNISPSLKQVEQFIQSIPNNLNKNISKYDNNGQNNDRCSLEHHVFPFANNYLGKALYCVPFAHDDYPKLKIASKLVAAKFLHREIREKGGAYGGGALLNFGGVFYFYSYRDPNIKATLDAFDESVKWLENDNNYSDDYVDEAKLSTFQDVDEPITPGRRGLDYFIQRISNEMRQNYRIKLLNVTKKDIVHVANRYLKSNNCGIALIGPKSEETSGSKWKIIEEKQRD